MHFNDEDRSSRTEPGFLNIVDGGNTMVCRLELPLE
jgi:hypothetical protein